MPRRRLISGRSSPRVWCWSRAVMAATSRRTRAARPRFGGADNRPAPQPAATPPSLPVKPAVTISPEAFTITADDPGLQLLAADEAELDPRPDGRGRVDGRAGGLAAIEPGGYLRPLSAGRRDGQGRAARGPATSPPPRRRSRSSRGRPGPGISARTSCPILTRLGCNTGACHGRLDGQNGFHLSLFGYDPAGDIQALARDGGQRRLSRLAPEESLFLVKATGRVPHGGGRRTAIGSPEYQTLLAWVRDGRPRTSRQDARGRWRASLSSPPAPSGSASPARGSSASSPSMPTATSAT